MFVVLNKTFILHDKRYWRSNNLVYVNKKGNDEKDAWIAKDKSKMEIYKYKRLRFDAAQSVLTLSILVSEFGGVEKKYYFFCQKV